MDTLHKSIQYALVRLGKSKSGFERTAVSNLTARNTRALGTSLLIIELRVLVLTKRHVGSGNEIDCDTKNNKEEAEHSFNLGHHNFF